jgi:MFS family permease
MLGSAITTVVLPLVVFDATGSVTQTGALFAVRVVPYLLFGVIAGPLADRGNRRFLIIGGNVAEGLLVATIPLAHAFGVLTVAQVYVVGLLSATAFVFSDAAVFGAVPALVGPERLSAANGFLYAQASAAEVAGPVVGGVLAASIGPANAVWVDSASFLVAAACQMTIRSTFRTTPPTAGGRVGIREQVGRALRFVRSHRTVATLIVTGFGNSFSFGAVLGLLVPYAVTELGLADRDARIGLLYGATGVGALIAGVVFGRLFRAERIRWLTPGTMLLSSTVAATLAVVSL